MIKGDPDKQEQQQIKRAIWGENEKEIPKEMAKYKKMKDLPIPVLKKVRTYLRRMNLCKEYIVNKT